MFWGPILNTANDSFALIQTRPVLIDVADTSDSDTIFEALNVNSQIFPWTTIAVVPGAVTSYFVSNALLPVCSAYQFQVVYQDDHVGLTSNMFILDILAPHTISPSNFALASADATSLNFTWDAPPNRNNLASFCILVFAQITRNDTWSDSNSWFVKRLEIEAGLLSTTVSCFNLTASSTFCLTPNTLYLVKLVAFRTQPFVASQPIPLLVRTLQSPPASAPIISSVDASTYSALILTCAFNSSNGPVSAVLIQLHDSNGYVVNDSVVPLPSQDLQSINSSCSQVPLSHLRAYSIYKLCIAAVDKAGPGPFSTPVKFMTLQGIVTYMRPPALAHSGSDILVSWVAPDPLPGILVSYDLRDDGLSLGKDIIYSGTATSTFVTSIVGALHVRTNTEAGVGNYSAGSALSVSSVATSSSLNASGVIAIVILATVTGLAFIGGVFFVVWRSRRQEKQAEVRNVMSARLSEPILANLQACNAGKYIVPREMDPDSITILDEIGQGEYGVVHKAMVNERNLARTVEFIAVAKWSKIRNELCLDESKFEAAIMAQLNHPNVIGLIGQVTFPDLFVIIAEYCEHGSLSSWLVKQEACDSVDVLTAMTLDIARGMEYISGLGLVHCDLAARNILLTSDYRCKISDFGSSKFTVDKLQADAAMMPIRWMAPESFDSLQFSTFSDVWSYGIVLFEIYSLGNVPYVGWSNDKVMRRVQSGYRLTKPGVCPDVIFDMMLRCWKQEPTDRDTFKDIVSAVIPTIPAGFNDSHSASRRTRLRQPMRFNQVVEARRRSNFHLQLQHPNSPMQNSATQAELTSHYQGVLLSRLVANRAQSETPLTSPAPPPVKDSSHPDTSQTAAAAARANDVSNYVRISRGTPVEGQVTVQINAEETDV